MAISPFKLERFFALYEFKVKYLLSSSDCESLSMAELLDMASSDSLRLWQTLSLGYTESPGHPLLRAEIARLYAAIPPDNVLVAAPEEAIFIAMQALLRAGDHVIVVPPTYQSLYEIARSIGCQVTPWTLQPTAHDWRLDVNELESLCTNRTRMLVINFPNNPTGYLPSLQEFNAIVEFARRHDLYIFSDEMYRLLEHQPSIQLPPICDAYAKGVSLSGLSKSLALPGLRIGWLAAQNPALIEQWLTVKDYTTICNSAPGEILGIIALQNKANILHRNLQIIHANITVAERFFAQHSALFSWFCPRAGSIAFPRWKGSRAVEQFCQGALDRKGVMIVPGSLFDFPNGHFRLGLGRKNFAEALEQVEEFLQEFEEE